jgi:hypothetical protein
MKSRNLHCSPLPRRSAAVSDEAPSVTVARCPITHGMRCRLALLVRLLVPVACVLWLGQGAGCSLRSQSSDRLLVSEWEEEESRYVRHEP